MARGDRDKQSGLIIIRLWRGDEGPADLRAAMTVKLDVHHHATDHAAAASVDDLAAEVSTWALAFLAVPTKTG
jgi:hypothetical protein